MRRDARSGAVQHPLEEVVSQAVGSALIPIASAALGQGNVQKARDANVYSLRITTILMVAIAAILFIFADYAVIPFTLSESMAELRPQFAHVLRIYAVLIPFFGLVDIGSSILQSLRLAQMSMVASFVRNLMIIVFLVFASRVSMDAIFYSLLVAEVIGGFMMLWLAKREFDRHAASEGFAEG
ncbi:MAG: MATE family efflux transporter [Thermoplasmata archaeon]|nr:MATE family efflux transporter [Thermoplasmata archaeon]